MTDTDALTEQIKRALWDALPDVSEEDYGSVEPWLDRDAAAVLPIIRKAQADAWDEGCTEGDVSAYYGIAAKPNPYRAEEAR